MRAMMPTPSWPGPGGASAVPGETHLARMARASVNGIEPYYEEHGSGPALLLVPGLGADTRLFGGVIGPLAATCHVIVSDLRGGGRSDKPPGPYTIEQMAPLALARGMHAAIARSALVEVPGGHVSLVTRERRRFAKELAAFVAS